ncbi:MAG: DUF349 domain-containing protein [Traorella sp.]
MTNEYNEIVEERDIDDEVKTRKELIEKAKGIQDTANWNVVSREISSLQRQWKRIPYFESALEDELALEFDTVIDSIYKNRKAGFESNKAVKEELIKKAKQLMNVKDFNKATKEMNDLMNEWKTSGSVGNKEEDDTLWNEFNGARQVFFENKHKNWEATKAKEEEARVAKEALVNEAKSLVDSNDWTKTNNKMSELMEQWKACGFSGRANENALWEEFNQARQTFFDRRSAHYKELRTQQKENLEAKKAIVEKAKGLVAEKAYTKEITQQVKNLTVDWKAVGSAGIEEKEVWQELRTLMDEYFAGLREFNEQRKQEWHNRLRDVLARKQELLNNQKRQLKRLQDGMVGLISQREVEDAEERIADKEEFIEQLEKDIADIENKLSK